MLSIHLTATDDRDGDALADTVLHAGRDMATLCRQEYSRPVTLLLWILTEVAIFAADFQVRLTYPTYQEETQCHMTLLYLCYRYIFSGKSLLGASTRMESTCMRATRVIQ